MLSWQWGCKYSISTWYFSKLLYPSGYWMKKDYPTRLLELAKTFCNLREFFLVSTRGVDVNKRTVTTHSFSLWYIFGHHKNSCLFFFNFIGHIMVYIKICHNWVIFSIRFSCKQLIQPSSRYHKWSSELLIFQGDLDMDMWLERTHKLIQVFLKQMFYSLEFFLMSLFNVYTVTNFY